MRSQTWLVADSIRAVRWLTAETRQASVASMTSMAPMAQRPENQLRVQYITLLSVLFTTNAQQCWPSMCTRLSFVGKCGNERPYRCYIWFFDALDVLFVDSLKAMRKTMNSFWCHFRVLSLTRRPFYECNKQYLYAYQLQTIFNVLCFHFYISSKIQYFSIPVHYSWAMAEEQWQNTVNGLASLRASLKCQTLCERHISQKANIQTSKHPKYRIYLLFLTHLNLVIRYVSLSTLSRHTLASVRLSAG